MAYFVDDVRMVFIQNNVQCSCVCIIHIY